MNKLLGLLLVLTLAGQAYGRDVELLDETAYRMSMEEVIVRGQVSEQRRAELDRELWNKDRFKLREELQPQRMQWFPRYDKEEREKYDGSQQPMEQEPEIKIFEWFF